MKTARICFFALLFTIIFSGIAFGKEPSLCPLEEMNPLEVVNFGFLQVKEEMKKIIAEDPEVEPIVALSKRREEIIACVNEIIDEEEASRQVLRRNWKKFNDEQKKEFFRLFKAMVLKYFSWRMQEFFINGSDIVVGKWSFGSSEEFATVKQQIASGNSTMEAIYDLKRTNGRWKIYCLAIGGISLTENYRDQFDCKLAKISPAQLLVEMEKHVKGGR